MQDNLNLKKKLGTVRRYNYNKIIHNLIEIILKTKISFSMKLYYLKTKN